jgi:hypothetical protein
MLCRLDYAYVDGQSAIFWIVPKLQRLSPQRTRLKSHILKAIVKTLHSLTEIATRGGRRGTSEF